MTWSGAIRRGALMTGVSLLVGLSGCSSFAAVRSARVDPGLSLDLRATGSTSPGDAAGWFWSFDCAQDCGRAIPSGEAAVTFSWVRAGTTADEAAPADTGQARLGAEVGVGVNGLLNPFLEGYRQIRGGDRPLGLGIRLGIPVPWSSSAVYARMDFPRQDGHALLFNPTIFMHHGNSPNGENPGLFVGLSPAAGYLVRGRHVDFVMSVAPMVGATSRRSYSTTTGGVAAFITAGLSIRFHP